MQHQHLPLEPACGNGFSLQAANADARGSSRRNKLFEETQVIAQLTVFRFQQFDLNISTQFSYGAKVFNLIRTTYESIGWSGSSDPGSAYLGQVYANNDTRVLKAWKKPGDITDIPRASYLLPNYFPNSDEFLENASYFKIRTVNLGYTLPKSKYYTSIRLYLQVQNLLTISKYTGFDPEVSSTGGGNDATAGIDYAAYPQARTVTVGASIKF